MFTKSLMALTWAAAAFASAGAAPLRAVPTPVAAQTAGVGGVNPASDPLRPAPTEAAHLQPDPRVAEADRLYWEHHVAESMEILESVLETEPESYEALWAAARSAVAQGLLSRERDIRIQWYTVGESYARRANEVAPEGVDGLYALLASKGLRATLSGSGEAVALGNEVYDLAHRLLAIDPLHAGAHHALGVLNFRVRRLPRVKRFVARKFLGGDVMDSTSWEDAERHLTRAMELRPDYILYHLDLGRMYLNRNRKAEARHHFERALELPVLEAPDTRFQRIARRRLAEVSS